MVFAKEETTKSRKGRGFLVPSYLKQCRAAQPRRCESATPTWPEAQGVAGPDTAGCLLLHWGPVASKAAKIGDNACAVLPH